MTLLVRMFSCPANFKILKSKIIYCIFLLLTFYSAVYPQQANLFSYENRLKFGNYLFEERDFLRAVDEYKACLKFRENDTLKFKIGQAYFEMGKYEFASEEFKTLFYSGEFGWNSKVEFLKTMFAVENYGEIYSYPFEPKGKSISEIQGKLFNLSFLLKEDELPGENVFFTPFTDQEKSRLYDFYKRKKEMPYKSPLKAALLSTVIPGLGKIYTGDYGDELTALLMTGLFAFLSYDNFRADHQFRAWLFTGLTGFFYAGNIYGSAASAQIHNAKVKAGFEAEVKLFLGGENYFLPVFRF